VPKGSTSKPKASQKKTAKAASDEGASDEVVLAPLGKDVGARWAARTSLVLASLSCRRLRRRPRPRPDDMMLD